MFQKITYSGSECNSYLYFSFDAEHFDTDLVTKGLNIEPTSVAIKENPVPKSTNRFNAGNEIALEAFLDNLIDVFESKIDTINCLKEKLKLNTRLQFVIHVDINPESSTPFFGLNKRAIKF